MRVTTCFYGDVCKIISKLFSIYTNSYLALRRFFYRVVSKRISRSVSVLSVIKRHSLVIGQFSFSLFFIGHHSSILCQDYGIIYMYVCK